MPKKVKDPDAKRLQKLRSALRNVWQYDPLRKAVISAVTIKDPENGKGFNCPICGHDWPIALATVDHEPELGSFTLETIGDWVHRLFYGPQRAICKPCHAKKPKGKRKSA